MRAELPAGVELGDKSPVPVPGLPRICFAVVTLPLQPPLLMPTADVLKSSIRVDV